MRSDTFLIDMITVEWNDKKVRILVDEDIFIKASALGQVFGIDRVSVQRQVPLPHRDLEERTIALTLYQQAAHIIREQDL